MKISSSASRIVFIIITLAACVFTYMKILPGESFMALAFLAYNHFFKKSSDQQPESTPTPEVPSPVGFETGA